MFVSDVLEVRRSACHSCATQKAVIAHYLLSTYACACRATCTGRRHTGIVLQNWPHGAEDATAPPPRVNTNGCARTDVVYLSFQLQTNGARQFSGNVCCRVRYRGERFVCPSFGRWSVLARAVHSVFDSRRRYHAVRRCLLCPVVVHGVVTSRIRSADRSARALLPGAVRGVLAQSRPSQCLAA